MCVYGGVYSRKSENIGFVGNLDRKVKASHNNSFHVLRPGGQDHGKRKEWKAQQGSWQCTQWGLLNRVAGSQFTVQPDTQHITKFARFISQQMDSEHIIKHKLILHILHYFSGVRLSRTVCHTSVKSSEYFRFDCSSLIAVYIY